MFHKKVPSDDLFEVLQKHLVNRRNVARILGLSNTAEEQWAYKRNEPSKSNYQRLRFLCYLVENPVLVAVTANQLYKRKDKLSQLEAGIFPFSALNRSISAANDLQCLNIIVKAYEGKEDKIPYGVRCIISETRRNFINALTTLHKHTGSGLLKDYSLEILHVIDTETVEVPKNIKVEIVERKDVQVV